MLDAVARLHIHHEDTPDYDEHANTDGQSSTTSDSSPPLSSQGSVTSEHFAGGWISRSPPTPPYHIDPRCRLSSPQSSTPHFPHQHSPRQSSAPAHHDGSPRNDTHSRQSSGLSSSEASSNDAWTSSSASGLRLPGSRQSWAGEPQLAEGAGQDVFSAVQLQQQKQNEQKVHARTSSVAVRGGPGSPSGGLTRRARKSSIAAQGASHTAHLQDRPLSRFNNVHVGPSQTPKASLISKRPAGRSHQHKRSYSVQWQNFERWQTKSQTRLRDFLGLFIGIVVVAVCLYQLCTLKSLASSKTDDKAFPNSLHLRTHIDQPQRDTVVLYRILGNDLPPRHGQGQTLRNLRFMLSEESDFSFLSSPASSYPLKVEKYYILNRLTSPETIDPILALFEEFGKPLERVLHIPFEWSEYAKQKVRWDEGVATADNLWGLGSPAAEDARPAVQADDKQGQWDTVTRLRAIEYTLHDKNLYAINNNGGRNYALQHGRNLPHARWILPMDGNCFFTNTAITSLLQSLLAEGEGSSTPKYVTIPMIRLLDNGIVTLQGDKEMGKHAADPMAWQLSKPEAPEEPQIGFRWDATESYQENMRYGRRSKLELLWRLGAIPFSRNLHVKRIPWEITDRQYLTASTYASITVNATSDVQSGETGKNAFIHAGWVHRLFSGERTMEENTKQAQALRKMNRMKGIVGYIEKLDERLVRGQEGCDETGTCGFNKDRLWHSNTREIARLRNAARTGDPEAMYMIGEYEEQAVSQLLSVPQVLRALKKDGTESMSATDIAEKASELAFFGYISTNTTFSIAAAELIQARFLSSFNLRRQPLSQSQIPVTEEGRGYAFPLSAGEGFALWRKAVLPATSDVTYDAHAFNPSLLLDTLRLLSPAYQPALSLTPILPPSHVRSLLSHHLRLLLLTAEGISTSENPKTYLSGIAYDASVASLAAYLDDGKLLARVHQRHLLRYMDPSTGALQDFRSTEDADVCMALRELYSGFINIGLAVDRGVEC